MELGSKRTVPAHTHRVNSFQLCFQLMVCEQQLLVPLGPVAQRTMAIEMSAIKPIAITSLPRSLRQARQAITSGEFQPGKSSSDPTRAPARPAVDAARGARPPRRTTGHAYAQRRCV